MLKNIILSSARLFFLCGSSVVVPSVHKQPPSLRSRASSYGKTLRPVVQTAADNQPLKVDIVPVPMVPYQINHDSPVFEGLIADYLKLSGEFLNRRIVLYQYKETAQAKQALLRGEIDLMPGHIDDQGGGIVSSQPYFRDFQVEVRRKDAAGQWQSRTVAYTANQVDTAALQKAYPDQTLVTYKSQLQAFEAVIFSRADLYVGSISSPESSINSICSIKCGNALFSW